MPWSLTITATSAFVTPMTVVPPADSVSDSPVALMETTGPVLLKVRDAAVRSAPRTPRWATVSVPVGVTDTTSPTGIDVVAEPASPGRASDLALLVLLTSRDTLPVIVTPGIATVTVALSEPVAPVEVTVREPDPLLTVTALVIDSVRLATVTDTIDAPAEEVPRANVRSAVKLGVVAVPIVTLTPAMDTRT